METIKHVSFERISDNWFSLKINGIVTNYRLVKAGNIIDKITGKEIIINDDYLIGETAVNVDLWNIIMKGVDSDKHPLFPITKITWEEASVFVSKLYDITRIAFRLPTEQEWEFAAFGGNSGHGYMFSGSNSLNEVAYFHLLLEDKVDNKDDYNIHLMKKFKPNELDIYDMTGNVNEFCQETETVGELGKCRLGKGGAWYNLQKQSFYNTARHWLEEGRCDRGWGLRLVV